MGTIFKVDAIFELHEISNKKCYLVGNLTQERPICTSSSPFTILLRNYVYLILIA